MSNLKTLYEHKSQQCTELQSALSSAAQRIEELEAENARLCEKIGNYSEVICKQERIIEKLKKLDENVINKIKVFHGYVDHHKKYNHLDDFKRTSSILNMLESLYDE